MITKIGYTLDLSSWDDEETPNEALGFIASNFKSVVLDSVENRYSVKNGAVIATTYYVVTLKSSSGKSRSIEFYVSSDGAGSDKTRAEEVDFAAGDVSDTYFDIDDSKFKEGVKKELTFAVDYCIHLAFSRYQ